MGAEQSSSKSGDKNNRDDFDRAVAARLRQMNRVPRVESRVTITTQQSVDRDATLKKDLEKALEEQRQLYETKMKNLLEEQNRATAASVQQAAAQQAALQAAAQQAAMQQAAAQQSMMQHQAAMQQQAAQQAAMQHAAAQQAAAQQAAAQQAAAHQAAAHQAAAQQAAMQHAAVQQAVMQQAAATQPPVQQPQQLAVQKAAAEKFAAEKAAAEKLAAQKAEAARKAEKEAALKAEAAAQQSSEDRKAKIAAYAHESFNNFQSGRKGPMTRSDLRDTLNFAIQKLYPALKEIERSTSPQPSSSRPNQANNVKQDAVHFKDSLQNVQKSRPKNEEDDITCPTCSGRYGEKIYQCSDGHSSCHLCKMRQVRCSTCRKPITEMRNINLEKYVSERKVKCPNAEDGCRLQIKIAFLDAHAKECPFKEMSCPSLGSCSWTGKLPRLSYHFDVMHSANRQAEVDKELFLPSIVEDSYNMQLVKIGNFNFLFYIKVCVIKQRIAMAVQLVGTKHSASKWFYEIHVYNKREPRRKFQYNDRCTSNRDAVVDIINRSKCAVLPFQYASTYFTEGALAYKFYIKKEEREVMEEKKGEFDVEVKKPAVFVNRRGRGRGGRRN